MNNFATRSSVGLLNAALVGLALSVARSGDFEPLPLPHGLPPAAPPQACLEGVYGGTGPDRSMTALSAASCATASCHGGPEAGNHAVQSFAATIWTKRDPHASAYETLYQPRSKRMAAMLGIGEAHRARQCLVCHSVQAASQAPLPPAVLADGVACSACHGDATEWLAIHHLPDWKHIDHESRAELGFRELADVASRARTCIPCHVGDASREVDHDMIAAGHPRLAFEFAAYQRRLPRHWSPRGKAESQADFTERSWAAGQAETIAAIARLLAVRSERAVEAIDAEARQGEERPVRWPEFAEFDCYSCHRSLSPERVEAAAKGPLRQPFPGVPSWQPWSVSGARLLAVGIDDPATASVGRAAVELRSTFEPHWTASDREQMNLIMARAKALEKAAVMAARAIAARQTIVLDASPKRLDAVVAPDRPDSRFWDSAAQTYLLMEAVADGGPAHIGLWPGRTMSRGVSPARESLDAIRASLRFAPGSGGPDRFDPAVFERDRRAIP